MYVNAVSVYHEHAAHLLLTIMMLLHRAAMLLLAGLPRRTVLQVAAHHSNKSRDGTASVPFLDRPLNTFPET
jgi:hypothetical protein